MPISVDLDGCLWDTPFYRAQVADREASAADLEQSIRALLKHATACHELANSLQGKSELFADELIRFAGKERSNDDTAIEAGLEKFGRALKEIETYRATLVSQMHATVVTALEGYLKTEFAPLVELRKRFNRASDETDSVLAKYASRKAGKDAQLAEAAAEVARVRGEFHRVYIEYVSKLNDIHAKRKFDFLEKVLADMYAHQTYFHHGFEYLKDLKPFMGDLTGHLAQARERYERDARMTVMQTNDIFASTGDLYNPLTPGANAVMLGSPGTVSLATGAVLKEGYLYKRASQRMIQSWDRRYFVIQGSLLLYYTRGKEDDDAVVATNLRLCTVKLLSPPDIDRRFCFQVVSPARSYILQGLSDDDVNQWVTILQAAIGAALTSAPSDAGDDSSAEIGLSRDKKERLSKDTIAALALQRAAQRNAQLRISKTAGAASPPVAATAAAAAAAPSTPASSGSSQLLEVGAAAAVSSAPPPSQPKDAPLTSEQVNAIRDRPGNTYCADCGASHPEWAVSNLGALVCIDCSGIHRLMGVSVSRVRALTLDRWDNEGIEIMVALGNVTVNAVFEAHPGSSAEGALARPTPKSDRAERLAWITAKYERRQFVNREPVPGLTASQALQSAAGSGDLASALEAAAAGASFNDLDDNGDAPLHVAVRAGDDRLLAFLLLNGAKPDVQNTHGETPLHIAAGVQHLRAVAILVKNQAKIDIRDANGKKPVDIAVERGNGDLVTIFRLMQLNEGKDGWAESPLDFLSGAS